LFVAVSEPTLAIRVPVAPMFISLSVSLSSIVETYSLTSIVHAAVSLLTSVVTSITHEPPLRAVTTPFSSTDATSGSLDI